MHETNVVISLEPMLVLGPCVVTAVQVEVPQVFEPLAGEALVVIAKPIGHLGPWLSTISIRHCDTSVLGSPTSAVVQSMMPVIRPRDATVLPDQKSSWTIVGPEK